MADIGFGVSPPEVLVLAGGAIICADFDGRCEGGEEEEGEEGSDVVHVEEVGMPVSL